MTIDAARVISVAQPWADFLIPSPDTLLLVEELLGPRFAATLPKTIENRTWKTRYRGTLFVHATTFERRDRAAMEFYGLTAHEKAFTYAAVVGAVDLVDITDDWVGRHDVMGLPPWGQPDMYHWQPRHPRRLRSPVHCRGSLGCRRPAPHVYANVLAQLAAATQPTPAHAHEPGS